MQLCRARNVALQMYSNSLAVAQLCFRVKLEWLGKSCATALLLECIAVSCLEKDVWGGRGIALSLSSAEISSVSCVVQVRDVRPVESVVTRCLNL